MREIRIIGLTSLPEVRRGDEVGRLIVEAADRERVPIEKGDVIVVTHKVVSKAEGRIVDLSKVEPSPYARQMARRLRKDSRQLEVILQEARRIVRMASGILIAETRHGFICANAGVDRSNVPPSCVALLPLDPDKSAWQIREIVRAAKGVDVAVIVSDTFGRPWREGQIDVAIGVAGLKPITDYRDMADAYGNPLLVSMTAVADEMAAAAELVMGKLDSVPVAIIKGARYTRGEGRARELVRRPAQDLFR